MVRTQLEPTTNGEILAAKHSRLYFEDGSLILKATAVLFKVHWGILRSHSAYFYETFVMPCFSAGRGKTESTPLVLQDVKAGDLESFLSFFYPSSIGDSDLSTSVDTWTSILTLASQWHFLSLRSHAIIKLGQITSPAQRISLAKSHHIPQWLIPAYIELCSQKSPLSRADARLLGLDDVLGVWEVQHELARGVLYEDGEVRRLVEAKFTLPLGDSGSGLVNGKGEPPSPSPTLVNGLGRVGAGSAAEATPPSEAFIHPASPTAVLQVDTWVPTPSPINLPLTEISPHPVHVASSNGADDDDDLKPSSTFHAHAEATMSLVLSTPQVTSSVLPIHSSPESPVHSHPESPTATEEMMTPPPPRAFSRTQSPSSFSPSPSPSPSPMFSMTPLGLVPRRAGGHGGAHGQLTPGNVHRQPQGVVNGHAQGGVNGHAQGGVNGHAQGGVNGRGYDDGRAVNGAARRAPGAAAVKQAALSAKRRKKAGGAAGQGA